MKLGIVADEISRDFATAVRIGKELGLMRYEIRNLTTGRAPMCDPQEMLEVERIAAGEGVEITALSPGLFKSTCDAAGFAREMSEVYPRAAEWAHRWHLPGLIVFGFHKPTPQYQVIFWLLSAGARALGDGLLLMIEPEPICRADTGRATADLIRQAPVPSLRINYDPGNVAWQTNADPIDEFNDVAPFIANVHIKDYRPGPTWLPAGEGIIDYHAHFRALQRIDYRGPISLEPHMDGSVETTQACKNAFERLWEGNS
jgi:sugar phosphate isomerase/epimerase